MFIDSDYQVGKAACGYDAIGCGDYVALGALFATKGMEFSPKRRLELALLASQEHNTDVCAPFIFACLEAPDMPYMQQGHQEPVYVSLREEQSR